MKINTLIIDDDINWRKTPGELVTRNPLLFLPNDQCRSKVSRVHLNSHLLNRN